MGIQKSVSKVLFSNVWTSIVGLLSLTYFARELGAAQLGTFFLFLSLARFSRIPVNFGIGGALTKRVSEGEEPESYLTTALLLVAGSLTVFSLILLVFRHQVNDYLGAQLTVVLIVLLAAQEGAALGQSTLSGELRVGETGTLRVFRNTVYVGTGVPLVWYGLGTDGIVFATILAELSVAAIAAYKISVTLGRPSVYHARSLVDYGKWGITSHIDTELYNWADVAILGLFTTSELVGAYEIAWRVSSVIVVLARSVHSTMLPHISSLDVDGRQGEIRELISNAITASVFLSIPSVFGVYVIGEAILGTIFGPDFIVAYSALLVLSLGKIIESIDGVLQSVASGIDRPDVRGVAVVASALSNVALNVILIPRIGLVGAAVATTVSFFLSTVFVGTFAYQTVKFGVQLRRVGWCVLSSVLMAGMLISVESLYPVDDLLGVAFMVALGSLSYMVLSLLYRPIRKDVLHTLDEVALF